MGYIEVNYDEKSHPKTSYPDKLIRYLIKRFRLGQGRVLEVGCGRGDFIIAFKNNGCECFAVDIESCSDVINEGIEFEIVNLENEKLPYDNGSFDVVFTKSVIEHLHNHNNFISECKRVLKTGGKLIVMTPDWLTCNYIFYNDYTHIRPYTAQSLSKLLLSHGLSVINCEQFIQYPQVWYNPFLKFVCRILQILGPARKQESKSSFLRWSRELILLAVACKTKKKRVKS